MIFTRVDGGSEEQTRTIVQKAAFMLGGVCFCLNARFSFDYLHWSSSIFTSASANEIPVGCEDGATLWLDSEKEDPSVAKDGVGSLSSCLISTSLSSAKTPSICSLGCPISNDPCNANDTEDGADVSVESDTDTDLDVSSGSDVND